MLDTVGTFDYKNSPYNKAMSVIVARANGASTEVKNSWSH